MPNEDLIKKFVDLHAQTEQLLAADNLANAKQKYLEVLNAYHEIESSPLEHFHKELAHDQVSALFKKVNETKERVKIPYNLIVAGVLILGLSVLVLLKPSIVGLVSLEDLVRQPVTLTFTESGLQQITLRDRPLTLSVSGNSTGNVKLYYKQGNKLELIYASNSSTQTFTDTCAETCTINSEANTIELFANIDKGTLNINEISYKIERTKNSPPTWKGATRTFKAKINQPILLDLADYFSDPEDDRLVYLSTTDEGLDVSVLDSKVTLTAKTAGTKNIIFVASDLLDVTRVPVTIDAS